MKINSNIPADKAVGFEIYHFAFDDGKKPELIKKYLEMGFMNSFQNAGNDLERKHEIVKAGAGYRLLYQ